MANFHYVNNEYIQLTDAEEAAFKADQDKFAADEAANGYKKDRQQSYPILGEQLDLLWHSIDADADLKVKLSGFYNAIKALKDKYPKPS